MKKHVSLLAVCLASLMLSACGGSSSDNGPPPNTKTTINVSNQTSSNFSSVSLEEHLTGKVFHAGSFDCAARQSDCKLYYTGSEITGSVVAFFKDSQGRIVGIYEVENAPGSYMAPEVSLWSTGAYLYDALANLNADFKRLSENERQAALSVFVAEKDAVEGASPIDTKNPLSVQTDHYEELALNYLNQQSSGAMTVAAYIENLAKRLAKREVAQSSEFLIPASLSTASIANLRFALTNQFKMFQESAWISTAHAEDSDSSCTSGLGAFMSIFQGGAGAIPSAFPIAAGVFKTVGAVGFAACNPQKVKLDAMINQLNNIQASLNNLTDDVGKLTNFVATAQMNTNLQDFVKVSGDLAQLGSNYQVIVGNNGVKSLKEYVQKVGGPGEDALRVVLSKEPDGIFANLLARLPATSDQGYLLQVQRLTENQFDTLTQALDLLCKDPRVGDILKQRVQCNLVIGTSTAHLLASQNIAYQIASDTYDLLDTYRTEATRYGYNLSKTAAENKAILKEKFDKQADLLVSKYSNTVRNSNGTKGVYDTLDGLPLALLSSITGANCSGNQADPFARVPSIVGWVKDSRNEHIVTNCKNFATPIAARYYLTVDGGAVNTNDVANVMGVLIPARYKVRSNNTLASSGNYFVPSNFVLSGSSNRLNVVLQAAPAPYTFAINSVAEWASSHIFDQIASGAERSHAQFFKAASNELDNTLPTWIDQLVFKWTSGSNYNERMGYAYVRYTDKTGYSVVFGLLPNYNNSYMASYDSMPSHCLTGDCFPTYTNASAQIGYLKFKDGPSRLELNNGWFLVDSVNPYR